MTLGTIFLSKQNTFFGDMGVIIILLKGKQLNRFLLSPSKSCIYKTVIGIHKRGEAIICTLLRRESEEDSIIRQLNYAFTHHYLLVCHFSKHAILIHRRQVCVIAALMNQ